MFRSLILAALLLALIVLTANAQPQANDLTRLLRFPDIHGDMIAFVYAGDI